MPGTAAYGERTAARYDSWFPMEQETAATVAWLDAAMSGRAGAVALEYGVGTGRVALPLAGRGRRVVGIEGSEPMLRRLLAKEVPPSLHVVLADFARQRFRGRFGVVYCVFNTLFALPSQALQRAAFDNASAHLDDGGVFVLEAFVPDLARLAQGASVDPGFVGEDEVMLQVTTVHRAEQQLEFLHVHLLPSGIDFYPTLVRYALPGELDLMAELAGLRLAARWGGWDEQPFDDTSRRHVSLYRRA